LKSCLARQRSANAAVAALFGRRDSPDRADSLRLKTVQNLAEEAGCAFFNPWATDGHREWVTGRDAIPSPLAGLGVGAARRRPALIAETGDH
jgi:hypothetical protein